MSYQPGPFICLITLLFLSPMGLVAEISVEGRVLAGKEPLADAEIRLVPWQDEGMKDEGAPGHFTLRGKAPQPLSVTRSSSDGTFRLVVPFMGLWKIQVEAPGRRGREMLLEPLVDALRLPAVDLPPAAEIQVWVTDAQGRTPLQAVVAWPAIQDGALSLTGVWRPTLSMAWTDPQGVGRLPVEFEGPHEVLVVARGFLPARAEWVESSKAVHVALRPGLPRAVEVTDLEGNPLPGTWLYPAGAPLPLAQTNSRGLALIPTPQGQPMPLTLISPKHRGTRELAPSETGAQGAVATLRLAPLRILGGKLVERTTLKPVSGALIWARPSTYGHFTTTNGEGAFALPGAPETQVSLMVATPDSEATPGRIAAESSLPLTPCGRNPLRSFQAPLSTQQSPDGARDNQRPAVELCYEPPVLAHRRLAVGRVVGEDGEPTEGAEVRWTRSLTVEERPTAATAQDLRRQSTIYSTDQWGRFEVPDPVPGRYDLEVRATDLGSVRVPGLEVPPGLQEVDLGVVTLGPGASIEGWVVDRRGRGVAGAEVLVGEPGAAPPEFVMSGVAAASTSDVHGHFVIHDLAPEGSFSLRVEKAGYAPREYRALHVPMAKPLEVVLTPASVVSGRVIDERGQGVPEALVTVHGQDTGTDSGRTTSSSSDGWFEVRGVRRGRLVLVATAPGFRRVRLTGFQVEAGDVLDGVEIVLERGGVLFGTVRDDSGTPVPRAAITLVTPGSGGQSADQGEAFSRTDLSGHFQLLGLEAGERLLVAEDDKGRRASRQIHVGQDVRQVDLTLEGGTDVNGWVRSEDGAPVADATVVLMDAVGKRQSAETRTDSAGRFLFAGVPVGIYYLLADATGFAATRLGIPVEVENFPLSGLEVVLSSGSTVRGQVLGVAFTDLPRVVIRTPGMGRGAAVGVDYEGRFILRDLPSGEVLVEAQVLGSGRRVHKSVFVPQAPGDVTLDLAIGTPE